MCSVWNGTVAGYLRPHSNHPHPPISCFHDHSGLHLLVPITFNHSSTQEQVLPSRAADTCTVCLSCRVFVHKRICLKCKLPLFCTTALPCLPAPLSLCGPLGNIVSFLRACSQCSHARLNCSFIQMNEALFCLENQTQTVHVRARRMSVENRGL